MSAAACCSNCNLSQLEVLSVSGERPTRRVCLMADTVSESRCSHKNTVPALSACCPSLNAYAFISFQVLMERKTDVVPCPALPCPARLH